MILIVDTTKIEKIILALHFKNKTRILKKVVAFNESEKILPMIDLLLKKNKARLSDLKAIFVKVGPGPFTSLRVGISLANTLAWARQIPIIGFNGSSDEDIKKIIETGKKRLSVLNRFKAVSPVYGKMPHITKPRKKWLT